MPNLALRCLSIAVPYRVHLHRRNDKGDRWHKGGWPAYTEGSWNPVSAGRKSVTEQLPLVCKEHDMCPLGTCSDGMQKAKEVCTRFYDTCFKDRSSDTFMRNLRTLAWTWVPSNQCYFSPLTVAAPDAWRAWAGSIESHEDGSPMLWVGDSTLQQHFAAFQYLTGGATHSDFHRSDVLVNSWTLKPMTSAQVSACEASAGASSGSADTPCPPADRNLAYWWEDNAHHRLSHSKWAQAFETQAASLKTLVLSIGDSWWKEYLYPSAQAKCHSASGSDAPDATITSACAGCPSADVAACPLMCANTALTTCAAVASQGNCVENLAQNHCPEACKVAHAYLPLTGVGHANYIYETIWRDCDVFSTKMAIAVRELAIYINSVSDFNGHVVVVTSPDGAKGCETVKAPNLFPSQTSARESDVKKPQFWYDSNPSAVLFAGTHMQSHMGKLGVAELAWEAEFRVHAPRLRGKVHVLNISRITDFRADGRTPDGECRHVCFPGVPHHWAEMMLRLLESNVFGATDGLY